MPDRKLYGDRDPLALDKAGGYFSRHMEALTAEDLVAKSEIAAELAYRDMLIDRLSAHASELEMEVKDEPVWKRVFGDKPVPEELKKLLREAKPPTPEEYAEQRISFAYGNLMGRVTKEHVRETARSVPGVKK